MTILKSAHWGMTGVFLFLLTLAVPAFAVTQPDEAEDGGGGKAATRHVLALTWQPGFCMTKPESPECLRQSVGTRTDARLSLHGLWQVKKSYCGIDAEMKKQDRSGKWTELPQLVLSEETAARLSRAMPGVLSGLDRHQWLMNGTCHAATAEDYYARSLQMLDTVNASAVGAFFSARAGKVVTIAEVAAAFDKAFGAGTGERVRLRCRTVDGEKVITGLTIGLSLDTGEFAALVRRASITNSRCDGGLLARAGDK